MAHRDPWRRLSAGLRRLFRRRLTSALAAATALALAGGVAALVVTSGGGGQASALAATARTAPAARAATAGTPPAQVLASPSPADPVDPARVPSAPATKAHASGGRTPAKAAGKPPPVVDGVVRTNVRSAHSPQIQKQLSAAPAKTAPPTAGARGIDVASFQHPHGAAIDWPRVAAAGYKFAFIKASEGDYYVNPYYATDLAHAKAAGVYVTGYHFAVPNVSGGASQAEYAVRRGDYSADGRTLPLALDIEYNPYGPECYGLSHAKMISWLSAFTAEARRLTGQWPIIYTTADWWHTCTGGSSAFGADPLWVAGYGTSSPPMPAGWADWTFWQYTSRGSVPGITGHVDVSYFLKAAVRLLDPGNQEDMAGTAIRLRVKSLNAAAGEAPRFTASHLPPGLSISGSGLITGAISSKAPGTYGVTITATNPSSGKGSVSFTWTVTSSRPTPPPSHTPSPSPSYSPSPSADLSPSPSADPSPSPSAETPSTPAPAVALPGVERARVPIEELDEESSAWLRRLSADADGERQAAEGELHATLVRIALAEVRRRSANTPVTGQELTDVAHQAADDAMVAVLGKLAEFRGESRFTTWAYRFVILEVSNKLGRHYWRNPPVTLDAEQWERLPDRFGMDPDRHAESAGMLAEVRRVVDEELTPHQRRIFVAIVVDGIPLDALAAELGLVRNAIYKVIFDARRKIRRALVAKGYLEERGEERR